MEKCVFSGYPDGYKGWKFYSPTSKHTVISECADFNERYLLLSKRPSSALQHPPTLPSVESRVIPDSDDDDFDEALTHGGERRPPDPPVPPVITPVPPALAIMPAVDSAVPDVHPSDRPDILRPDPAPPQPPAHIPVVPAAPAPPPHASPVGIVDDDEEEEADMGFEVCHSVAIPAEPMSFAEVLSHCNGTKFITVGKGDIYDLFEVQLVRVIDHDE
ncbi:hypothetical protein EV702DRAFT_1196512 [Suillus placidus]|uniref:Retroviral polymerase SH3-like domain-containing protein n=1 Tax=Suillus placidus TaxID=48579 RepID=A0A9P7D3U3_9AGAM|nr:hypothetical protein EV702DRAFT_1196512 [Suillus placidus]